MLISSFIYLLEEPGIIPDIAITSLSRKCFYSYIMDKFVKARNCSETTIDEITPYDFDLTAYELND